MKKRPSRSEMKRLVSQDEMLEHCENIAVLAGLLAAGSDSMSNFMEPELAKRAGLFILNETHELEEALRKY